MKTWLTLFAVVTAYILGWMLYFEPRGFDKWTYVGVCIFTVIAAIIVATIVNRRRLSARSPK